ncbi:MAG: 50S ribosomal protein L3 [Candidatus Pacearchaeota archaeon]
MPKIHKPRAGSLQFWPRKRAAKLLPSVNWKVLEKKYIKEKGVLGFICYKAGMCRAVVLDLTPDSMTKNKQIIVPITILECPSMKILGIRLYKNNKVVKDFILKNLPKELKHKIKLPKKESEEKIEEKIDKVNLDEIDNIRVIAYSIVKQTSIKKTPDIAEIGLAGTLQDKLEFIKTNLNKDLTINDLVLKNKLVDVRGVTKGHGLTGPIKRFGIGLKSHKTEKGRRRPGTLGPWHPAHVSFRVAMAGQYGFFTRIHYNSKILNIGKAENIPIEFSHYGKIKTNYIALKGSVQGTAKRQLLITSSLRETKSAMKENFEIIKILK